MKSLSFVIKFYIIKTFLKRFFYVTISISLLAFIINLFDVVGKSRYSGHIASEKILTMAFLQTPAFLSDIAIFIIFISAMLTLFSLSNRSEITVMRSCGMSIWGILYPMIITSFCLGIIFIFAFLPATISASKKFTAMEKTFIDKEDYNGFEPKNGIWLRQDNVDNKGEDIKIRAVKIYKKDLQLEDVTMWFFDKDAIFYRKIDAKKMWLTDGKWHLQSAVINDKDQINRNFDELYIKSNLEPEFILQKVINNFEDVKLFSVLELPKLIQNMESSGFSSRKFKVYFHLLLTYPLLFVAMTIIAAFFAINHIRNRNNIIYLILGMIFGLFVYICLNIVNALGSSGIMPYFAVTWLMLLLLFASGILMVFKKENLG